MQITDSCYLLLPLPPPRCCALDLLQLLLLVQHIISSLIPPSIRQSRRSAHVQHTETEAHINALAQLLARGSWINAHKALQYR